MGLPQVSAEAPDESAGSLNSFVSIPSQFGSISNSNSDLLLGGVSAISSCGERSCPSINSFQSKTMLELPKVTDGLLKYRRVTNGAVDIQGLKIDFEDANSQTLTKSDHIIRDPVVRIVGFDSSHLVSSVTSSNIQNRTQSSKSLDSSVSSSDFSGSQLRKRMLSPQSSTQCKHFHGDSLDISSGNYQTNFHCFTRTYSLLSSSDSGKPSSESANTVPIYPISKFSNLRGSLENCRWSPDVLVDGPVSDSGEPFSSYVQLPSQVVNTNKDCESPSPRATFVYPEKALSTPPSLSPLGPIWSDRMQIAVHRDLTNDIRSDFSILKSSEGPNAVNVEETRFSPEQNLSSMDAFVQDDMFHQRLDTFTSQRSDINRSWDPHSAPTPQTMNHLKSFGMLPVRRSLVGSFEESLLSGRFSSGKVGQVLNNSL